MSADHLELADGAVGADDGAQVNRAGEMDVARERGIFWLHFVYQRGGHHAFAAVQQRFMFWRLGLLDFERFAAWVCTGNPRAGARGTARSTVADSWRGIAA